MALLFLEDSIMSCFLLHHVWGHYPSSSRRQRRRREAGSEGSRMANPCTEEHEPHRRRGGLGEPAKSGEARHHQEAVR